MFCVGDLVKLIDNPSKNANVNDVMKERLYRITAINVYSLIAPYVITVTNKDGVPEDEQARFVSENDIILVERSEKVTYEKLPTVKPSKVSIPDFVTDEIGRLTADNAYLIVRKFFDKEYSERVLNWIDNNNMVIMRAALYGYKSIEPKLYIVDIPAKSKQEHSDIITLVKSDDQLYLTDSRRDRIKNSPLYQHTEEEIRSVYPWIWENGFYKQVENFR